MAGLKRRLPRMSEVARFVGPTFRRRTTDRWSRVRTVADFERLARQRTPRSVFDYVEGAAELELSRDRAVAAADADDLARNVHQATSSPYVRVGERLT